MTTDYKEYAIRMIAASEEVEGDATSRHLMERAKVYAMLAIVDKLDVLASLIEMQGGGKGQMTLYQLHCKRCKQSLIEFETLNGSQMPYVSGYCIDCHSTTSGGTMAGDLSMKFVEVVKK